MNKYPKLINLQSEMSIAQLNLQRFMAIERALDVALEQAGDQVDVDSLSAALCYAHNLELDTFDMITTIRDDIIKENLKRKMNGS